MFHLEHNVYTWLRVFYCSLQDLTSIEQIKSNWNNTLQEEMNAIELMPKTQNRFINFYIVESENKFDLFKHMTNKHPNKINNEEYKNTFFGRMIKLYTRTVNFMDFRITMHIVPILFVTEEGVINVLIRPKVVRRRIHIPGKEMSELIRQNLETHKYEREQFPLAA